MNRQIEPSKRGRRTARSLALGLVTLIVGSAAVLLAPVAATAAPVSAITDVQITNAPPLVAQTPYTVEATWAVDDSAQSGDTFMLDFPDSMTGYVNSFDLKDAAGATVGTCDVAAGSFLCTLGDYVDTHTNVHGTLHFQARFTEAVEEEEVIFTTDNDVKISVPVPGGVGVPDSTTPQGPQKWGFVNNDGESMTWVLTVPAEYLDAAGGAPVTVVDNYDPALTFNAAASSGRWTYDADWGNNVWHPVTEGSGAETYSVVNDAAAHTFTVTFNQPVTSNDRLYQFVTVMDFPANAQDGQSFGNTMKIADRTITAKPVVYVSSGGTGTGDGLGAFDVTKSVTGTGATKVAGSEYTVNYSYTVDGVATTGELTLTDGATDGLADLPEGTVVTLSEVAATGTGVTYGTPVYTGTGVTDNGDGTASFTITDDTIAIALENPVTTNLGAFDVTKTVTGTGATTVKGTEYTVNYSYTVDGVATTGELTLTDGATDGLADLPEGTVVTLSEVAATGTGVTYGTPVYTGTGVTDNGDGTASFTITDDTIAIALENPVTTNLGAFDVTKTVTGTGATKVAGSEYTVNYSYTVDGVATTGELTLTDGATDGLADLPEGTVVTLSEVAATGTGVTYGTPVYTGTGVTDNGDGTASFTITDDTIAITLENPVTTVPPTVPPTVPQKPGNPGGSLAITGADSGPFLAIGAATLAAGLALLIARRLRRRS